MSAIVWRVRRADVTASTNDDARAAAEQGEGEGLVIIAKRQSAGRGRQGRVWESPEGNLYASILLQPNDMPKSAGAYSFIAALAIRDALAPLLTTPISLKWPNDVLVSGKKISGVLLEVAGDKLIIGIGLNIAHHPEQSLYPATSLAAEGAADLSVASLLDRLLHNLAIWHARMQEEGFAPIRQAWQAHARTGKLTVRLQHEVVTGDYAGLDEHGHLRLLLEDGAERSISTGDVLFAPKE